MNKIFKYILSLSLILVAMFSFAGCGGNNPGETPPETPTQLVFTEEFGFDGLKTYSTGSNSSTIEGLSQSADYKSISLYARKNTSFNHLSFKIKSNSAEPENLYVSVLTPSASWISETIQISTSEVAINIYYVKWGSGSHEFLTQKENSGNNPYTLDNISFTQNDKLTIYFGTKSEALNWKDYYATGKYNNPVSVYGFEIE